MSKTNLYNFLLFITILNISCSTTITTVSDYGLKDDKYDRDFFQVESNDQLNKLVSSTKMIN